MQFVLLHQSQCHLYRSSMGGSSISDWDLECLPVNAQSVCMKPTPCSHLNLPEHLSGSKSDQPIIGKWTIGSEEVRSRSRASTSAKSHSSNSCTLYVTPHKQLIQHMHGWTHGNQQNSHHMTTHEHRQVNKAIPLTNHNTMAGVHISSLCHRHWYCGRDADQQQFNNAICGYLPPTQV